MPRFEIMYMGQKVDEQREKSVDADYVVTNEEFVDFCKSSGLAPQDIVLRVRAEHVKQIKQARA